MMLHYYEVDIVPLHDDRAAVILLSIVNQVSDSQMLIIDYKPASHLQARYNKISTASSGFHTEKKAKLMYFKYIHNYYITTDPKLAMALFPSWSQKTGTGIRRVDAKQGDAGAASASNVEASWRQR